MDDDWEEIMPDDGDYEITFLEAAKDVLAFFAKAVGTLALVALVIFCVAYPIWREFMIFSWLVNQ